MVSRIMAEISDVLQNKLAIKWINFPKVEEYDTIKQRFFEETGFPGVIGAIDCTHVRIQKPNREVEACYLNRKGFHSKNVQLICDFNLKILGVFARYGGAAHNAYIWQACQTKALLERRYEAGEPTEHNSWLLVREERLFNTFHARTRNCVERLNGVLKSVFRCLKLGLFYSPQAAGKIINACCVLHNFRIHHGLPADDVVVEVEDDEMLPYHQENSSVHLRKAIIIRDRIKTNICR